MFVATRAARSAKLRRSGMYSRSISRCQGTVEVEIPIHAAPTELGRASGVVVTINMALLTELEAARSPRIGAGGSRQKQWHHCTVALNLPQNRGLYG